MGARRDVNAARTLRAVCLVAHKGTYWAGPSGPPERMTVGRGRGDLMKQRISAAQMVWLVT
jgi:hypothetical protein